MHHEHQSSTTSPSLAGSQDNNKTSFSIYFLAPSCGLIQTFSHFIPTVKSQSGNCTLQWYTIPKIVTGKSLSSRRVGGGPWWGYYIWMPSRRRPFKVIRLLFSVNSVPIQRLTRTEADLVPPEVDLAMSLWYATASASVVVICFPKMEIL